MNEIKPKQYCEKCDCVVKVEGHDARCRPRVEVGWSVDRQRAFFGDTVQRMDVQLALKFMCVPAASYGEQLVRHTANRAMADYIRVLEPLRVGSDHSLGTYFESKYCASFRVAYLRVTFPSVCEQVLVAWQPPILDLLV